jgi:hypothetical protein
LEDDDFLLSVFCKEASEYLRNGKSNGLEISAGKIYGL